MAMMRYHAAAPRVTDQGFEFAGMCGKVGVLKFMPVIDKSQHLINNMFKNLIDFVVRIRSVTFL